MSERTRDIALADIVSIIKSLGLPADLVNTFVNTMCNLKGLSVNFEVFEGMSDLKVSSKRNIASRIYKTNIFREEAVDYTLCRDPVWNMMLDLFTANEDGSKVTISSLCAASNAAYSTALRQISHMEQHGFIRRKPVGGQSRLVHVEPTGRTIDAVTRTIDRLCGLPARPAQE